MFSALDNKELKTLIDAMEEQNFKKDEVVIKQGDDGEVLFLLDTGKLDCFKRFNNDEKVICPEKPLENLLFYIMPLELLQ